MNSSAATKELKFHITQLPFPTLAQIKTQFPQTCFLTIVYPNEVYRHTILLSCAYQIYKDAVDRHTQGQ